jgi:predicted enzyme related to lactoylglutathione lyase
MMEKISGIGGIFLRARDPKALAAWYQQYLGIAIDAGQTYGCLVAKADDMTVWSTFSQDTDYFGSRQQQTMVNYRVSDLDAMLAQLRAGGAVVDDKVQDEDYGRFGWATDPEGNRFELWQPK